MKLHIGCSGWNYEAWKGKFYPEELDSADWLEYYMGKFNSVEVNNTFYQLPEDSTLDEWKRSAYGKDFEFSLKGSRYVTHMKKLNDPSEGVEKFEQSAEIMKTKLGCILWQIPPNLHRDDERLENFCDTLSGKYTHVIEFRHQSWFHKEIYELLDDKGVSFCSISCPGLPEDLVVTGKVAYLRFHGKGKEWYDYDYSLKELKDWKDKLKESGANEAFIYFNNDIGAKAPVNASDFSGLFREA